ncbi:esterase/lipase family protein [Streptomyces sp. NPDC050149]|uniref:esterase/lipase family protein n=1 Tax=Streptomyces sp. NPDC050149 TaxID=3365603 RepID=UPI0037A2E790
MNRPWKTPRRRRPSSFAAALVGVFVAALLGPASSASAAAEPTLGTPAAMLDAALHCPGSFAHPDHEPVLLVHGTSSTGDESWGWGYAPALRDAGYDVCTVDLTNRSMGDIQESTEYVVRAVGRINSLTGRKVDVIGHSQGNMQIRWALKWWPSLQTKVDDAVFLANPGHGIGAGNLFCTAPCAPALHQFSVGSNFLAALNAGDETPGAVSYTNLYSLTDEAIVPVTTAPVSGAANVSMQSVCPGRTVTHFGFLYDSVAYGLVVDALSHSGTVDPGRLPFGKCLDVNLPGVTLSEATAATGAAAANMSAELLNATKVWAEPSLRAYALS